jgi:hypothetical protein
VWETSQGIMSIVFSDNFNAGYAPGAWQFKDNVSLLPEWGFNRTQGVGCANGQMRNDFGQVCFNVLTGFLVHQQGSLRVQVAAVADGVNPSDDAILIGIVNREDICFGPTGNAFSLLTYLRFDGALYTRVNLPTFSDFFDTSPAGVFPIDGFEHGLQVRWALGSPHQIIYTIDDVDVHTITWSAGYGTDAISSIWLYPRNSPGTLLTVFDNCEFDDSSDAVSWPAGNAVQLDLSQTCFGPPPPDVSTLALACPPDTTGTVGIPYSSSMVASGGTP